jgi:histidine triad (HIT) family protein
MGTGGQTARLMPNRMKSWSGFQLVYAASKSRLLGPLIIWSIAHMSNFKPDQVISETDSLICFHHPQPGYPIHILLVPREDVRDLMQLDPEESVSLRDVFATVRDLVETMNLQEQGYRLVVNGGKYQEFPQLHFHLISGE